MERNKEVTHQIRNILKTTGKAAIVLLLENFRGNELIERSILSDYLKGIDFFFTEKVFSAVSQTTEQCYTRYLRMIITFYGQKGFDLIFQHLDTLAVEQLLKTGETLLAMNVDKKIIKDRYKKFLQSTNNEKRDAAYKVIAKCGGAEVLPALKKDIESEQKDKVATAIQALGYFKGLEALKLLTATYWQENYQQWRPNILHALSLRQEPDVLNQFLLLLEEEEPKGKIAVVEKLIEHRLTAYQLDSGFFSTMDYAKTMPKILTNLENREISMLEQWLINSRRPSSLDFLHHISATLQLVPTNWKMTVIDAGIFLTAPAFLLMLDHTFRRESRKSIASAVTLLEKIALMPVLRILYPSLFADGGLSLNWLRKEKTNETNEILPISLILLFQGDPTITKQILQFMTETEDSNLFSALELYIESNAEMEFRNSAISVIGKLQTPEAREKLVALSSNKEHDLSKKARQVLDESREGELL
jgi:HEAT repeat protein